MATRLIQVVTFANVPAAGAAALPHNINIKGTQYKPDFVALDTPGFTVVVTATTVTVTNTTEDAASVGVWLELKHTIPRQLGALPNLTPQPFIAAAGAGGGGNVSPAVGGRMFDDFISVANIATSTAGGGTVSNNDSSALQQMVGLVRLNGGVGGSACVFPNADPTNVGFANPILTFTGGRLECEWRLKWQGPVPGLGADAHAYIGIHDLPILGGSNSVPSDGILFQAGFSLNGNANWWARILGNGDQAIDTGIAIQTATPVRLKMIAIFGGDAEFFVNDVSVGTIPNATANTDGFDLTVAADGQGISTLLNVALDYYDFNYTR